MPCRGFLALAAALAVLEVLKEEVPPSHVEEVGAHLRKGFESLKASYPIIGNLLGRGFMQGIEFVKDPVTREPFNEACIELFEQTRERGLLIGAGGLRHAFRFTSPLIATKQDIDRALEILDESIAAVMEIV